MQNIVCSFHEFGNNTGISLSNISLEKLHFPNFWLTWLLHGSCAKR